MKVEKIVLDINGKKVELSLEDAKELKEVLDQLFPDTTQKVVYIPSVWYPYYHIQYDYDYNKKWYYDGNNWSGIYTAGSNALELKNY